MSKGFIDLSNKVYEIHVDFRSLCSLIDTLHIAVSGDQILEEDTIMTYTEIMKDYSDKIRNKLDEADNMTEEGEKQQPTVMRMDTVTPSLIIMFTLDYIIKSLTMLQHHE